MAFREFVSLSIYAVANEPTQTAQHSTLRTSTCPLIHPHITTLSTTTPHHYYHHTLPTQAAGEIGADSIVMDCEDGVAANMKDQARQTIALMLDG